MCHRTIHSRHHNRPTEHDKEEDTRSEASNRQPKGDIIGDDLPLALIEVSGALASRHAKVFCLVHLCIAQALLVSIDPLHPVRNLQLVSQQVSSHMLATHCYILSDVEGQS